MKLPNELQISEGAVELVKEFEGLGPIAYLDAVGVLTIGYGHTMGVYEGQTVTKAQAEQYLRDDLREAQRDVQALVKVPVSQQMFDALCSFDFNLGANNLGKSTLLKYLNQGMYSAAADQFLRWDHAGGRVLKGLSRRRAAERALFLTALTVTVTADDGAKVYNPKPVAAPALPQSTGPAKTPGTEVQHGGKASMWMKVILQLLPLLPTLISDVQAAVEHFNTSDTPSAKVADAKAGVDHLADFIAQVMKAIGE